MIYKINYKQIGGNINSVPNKFFVYKIVNNENGIELFLKIDNKIKLPIFWKYKNGSEYIASVLYTNKNIIISWNIELIDFFYKSDNHIRFLEEFMKNNYNIINETGKRYLTNKEGIYLFPSSIVINNITNIY